MERKIRILGVNGGPRKSATFRALQLCLEAAETVEGVETVLIDLAGKKINTCTGCNVCRIKKLGSCPVHTDDFKDEYMDTYRQCDAVLLASPVYSMSPSGLLLNFLGRMRPSGNRIAQGYDGLRLGGAIAVGGRRNGGQELVLASLNAALQSTGTNIIGGGVYFYNGASIWSQNQRDFDDPTGQVELGALGRKLAFAAKVVNEGIRALEGQVKPANCAGFTSEEEQAKACKILGL